MLTRAFGKDEHPFCLKVAQWRDLEKARDAGLGVIAARLAPLVAFKQAGTGVDLLAAVAAGHLGHIRLDDVREPVLQGLIGGGLTSTEAGALVRCVFDEAVDKGKGPVFDWCDLAFAIVTGALIGLEDEPPGEPVGKTATPPEKKRRSKTAKPISATSTEPSR
jgi:hypothetical protein